jgi:sulfite reductase (ferredoxin)
MITPIVRDYRGVGCPENFARITMDLVDMPCGSIFAVRLDTDEQVANVSRSLIRDGQAVLESLHENGYWNIIVRKDTEYL